MNFQLDPLAPNGMSLSKPADTVITGGGSSSGSGGGTWGSIGGDIADQADLQAALSSVTSSLAIGDAIGTATAYQTLYVDGDGNLAQAPYEYKDLSLGGGFMTITGQYSTGLDNIASFSLDATILGGTQTSGIAMKAGVPSAWFIVNPDTFQNYFGVMKDENDNASVMISAPQAAHLGPDGTIWSSSNSGFALSNSHPVNAIHDDNSMSDADSNSLATSGSIKAYVDNIVDGLPASGGGTGLIGSYSFGSDSINFYDGQPSLDIDDYTATSGDILYVRTSGSKDFGDGTVSATVGDYLIYNEDIWEFFVSGSVGASVTPGGSSSTIQFNDGGSFGGSDLLKFTKTTGMLTMARGGNLTGAAQGTFQTHLYITDDRGFPHMELFEYKSTASGPGFGVGLGVPVHNRNTSEYPGFGYYQDLANDAHVFRGLGSSSHTNLFNIKVGGSNLTTLEAVNLTIKPSGILTLEGTTLNISAGPSAGHASISLKTTNGAGYFQSGSNDKRKVHIGNNVTGVVAGKQLAVTAADTSSSGLHLRMASGTQAVNMMEIFNGSNSQVFAINKDGFPVIRQHTPSSSSDTGQYGQITWDNNYIYIAVGTDTWKRASLTDW